MTDAAMVTPFSNKTLAS